MNLPSDGFIIAATRMKTMLIENTGIELKQFDEMLAATLRVNLKDRAAMRDVFSELVNAIPAEHITGRGFCFFQFITSFDEGYDVEIGFPVKQVFENGRISTRKIPSMQVLSVMHIGPLAELSKSHTIIREYFHEHGLISDEFRREEYCDWRKPESGIEVQYVLHDWSGLLGQHLERVLGNETKDEILQGVNSLSIQSNTDDRFQWAKGAMEKLGASADTFQKFDIVSSCAHVFPKTQLVKLRNVFQAARSTSGDPMVAVDAVLDFMAVDKGWKERPNREGSVVFSTKQPADPVAYKKATTPTEKRAAYCFCPVIRDRLDKGMPITYCNCGAGWFREQWETATGKPVMVDILQSVLKGDDVCQFAIHLSPDI
jgi:effector-binding domain-containing protein